LSSKTCPFHFLDRRHVNVTYWFLFLVYMSIIIAHKKSPHTRWTTFFLIVSFSAKKRSVMCSYIYIQVSCLREWTSCMTGGNVEYSQTNDKTEGSSQKWARRAFLFFFVLLFFTRFCLVVVFFIFYIVDSLDFFSASLLSFSLMLCVCLWWYNV